jgi:hypothetical protein
MSPLKQTLFLILKHTKIQINPGEPIDIKRLLLEMQDIHLLSEEELRGILEGLQ